MRNDVLNILINQLIGWLYQKTNSVRLVGLITSATYIVGNVAYSMLSLFPEGDTRFAVLLATRFVIGMSSGTNDFINVIVTQRLYQKILSNDANLKIVLSCGKPNYVALIQSRLSANMKVSFNYVIN